MYLSSLILCMERLDGPPRAALFCYMNSVTDEWSALFSAVGRALVLSVWLAGSVDWLVGRLTGWMASQ